MNDAPPPDRWLRTSLAVLIGLLGAVAIWIIGPYNNYLFSNTNITDGFLPLAVLTFTLILVLGVNPLLRWIRPRLALSRGQMAMIVGVMLVAAVVPGQGLMRMLPSAVVRMPVEASSNRQLAETIQKMHLPGAAFPDEIAYGAEVPVSSRFVGELDAVRGESVPWGAWVGPLYFWGSLVLFGWLMMIGLAAIVMPQWRDNERLPFPLLRLQESMIAPPEKGRLVGPMFRDRKLWVAIGVVVVLRLLNGLSSYYPDSVPSVPLRWDLGALFTEEPWVYLRKEFYQGQLFFLLVGIAFFIPNRTSFSLWFLVVAYFFYEMVGKAYFPASYSGGSYRDHRLGAIIAISVCVLWLGRKRWGRVFKRMFSPRSREGRQDALAGWMFSAGVAGMFCWLVFAAKVQAGFALVFTVFAFMTSLTISRAIAEAGIPFFKIRSELYRVVRLFPAKLVAGTSAYFAVMMGILFTVTTRSSAAALSTHALALNEDVGRRNRGAMGLLLVAVLVIGFLVSGAVHLDMNYHNSVTLDDKPLSTDGGYFWASDAIWSLRSVGQEIHPTYSREFHVGFGFTLAVVLFVLCLAMPRWPLHPIGLLCVSSWMGNIMWPSVFVCWLVKQLMVRYGGARLYRSARPFFLGLIVGEVFSAMIWTVVPLLMWLSGQPYTRPQMTMLF